MWASPIYFFCVCEMVGVFFLTLSFQSDWTPTELKMNVKQYDWRKNPCVPELLSPGNTSQLIEQNEGFCLGSHHEIRSVYKYMHKETHTNTLKEHFIWTGSTYQRGDLWGTVEHGQAEITGRMLFWKANEIFLVHIFFCYCSRNHHEDHEAVTG